MSCNPFSTVGKVVSGNDFIGREKEIRELKDRVLGDTLANASIVGLPRIGKTSLMNHVFLDKKESDQLWNTRKILTIFYVCKDYSDPNIEGYPEDVFLDIIHEILKQLKIRGFEDEDVKEYAQRAKDHKGNSPFQQFSQDVIDFFDELAVFNDIGIIICVDEFDNSKWLFSSSYYQLMRILTDNRPNIAFVTTSRRSILDIEKDSGGGSSFYESCLHVYLKSFNDDETNRQRSLIGDLSDEEVELLDLAVGNHPYLNALILRRYYQNPDMESCIDESYQDIVHYYDRLMNKVLKNDCLDDKVINLYCGFLDAVSQEEEKYITERYGLFTTVANDGQFAPSDSMQYVPFCESFNAYMRQLYRRNPYGLVWPRAERSIKLVISNALSLKYGPNPQNWLQPIKDIFVKKHKKGSLHFSELESQMSYELYYYHENGSDNIVDQFYPKDFCYFISEFWNDSVGGILGHDLQYWTDRIGFIANKVRNPESHSRLLLDDETKNKASVICQEIIKCAEKQFGHIE